MKKILSFSSVAEFMTYTSALLVPKLDYQLDESKLYSVLLTFSGAQYLSVSAFASRLMALTDGKTFSFHISRNIISRDDGRFVTGTRRRFVIKRLSSNNYSVYERL